jgi:Mrp family chromosome partitioning ATPase
MALSIAKKTENELAVTDTAKARSILYDYILLPQCKRLINRIITLQNEKGFKSLAALSNTKREGKTVFISVIALGLHRLLDRRVLIIDTISENRHDSFYYREFLAKPASGETSNRRGCIDLLTSRNLSRKNMQMYQKTPELVTDLEVPVLYDETSTYEGSDFQLTHLINEMKRHYDLILIDTAALNDAEPSPFDPLILAEHADASILLATPDTERDVIMACLYELQRNRINPLGIVMDVVCSHG